MSPLFLSNRFTYLIYFVVGGLLLLTAQAQAQRRLVVAPDGSGDYRTVQQALDALPAGQTQRTTIFIKKGVYKEKLTLAAGKDFVSLLGEDAATTILTYDDYAQKQTSQGQNIGTSGSASFFVRATNFSAENITFANSAGPVGQALAIWVGGDRVRFKNCRFLGNQDTIYTGGRRQYYQDCYIEGTTDFIFGSSTAWFENCELFCKKGGSYLTAASTPDTVRYGYVFNRCRLTGDAPAQSYYLGRPWRPYAKVVFFRCQLGLHIKSEGWHNWGKASNEATAYYAEFASAGPGAAGAQRAAWSHQLTKQEASDYTLKQVLGDWQP
ncbi:pectinesterase family protein [Hymenobacter bucti]|uniref:Pectinesterase n=1 Tax=Hymenobacter bucti TaxID=1844114 RepID=A0ABW4QY98_9BACT